MSSRAAPLLLAALAGFGLAVLTHGVTFGLGIRYCVARANPSAFETVLREAWQSAIKLGREADSLRADMVDLKRRAREREVRIVEVPVTRNAR